MYLCYLGWFKKDLDFQHLKKRDVSPRLPETKIMYDLSQRFCKYEGFSEAILILQDLYLCTDFRSSPSAMSDVSLLCVFQMLSLKSLKERVPLCSSVWAAYMSLNSLHEHVLDLEVQTDRLILSVPPKSSSLGSISGTDKKYFYTKESKCFCFHF